MDSGDPVRTLHIERMLLSLTLTYIFAQSPYEVCFRDQDLIRSVFLRIRRTDRKTKKDLKRTEAEIHTSTY